MDNKIVLHTGVGCSTTLTNLMRVELKKFPRDCLYETPKCKFFKTTCSFDSDSYICECSVINEQADIRHPKTYELIECPLYKINTKQIGDFIL